MSESKSIISSAFDGLRYVTSSFGYIRSHKLTYVYVWAFLSMVVVLGLGVGLASIIESWVGSYVEDWLQSTWMPDYMVSIMSGVSSVLAWAISFVLMFMFRGTLVLLLLSPVFTAVATKVREDMAGLTSPFEWRAFFISILRGVIISLRNMLLQMFFAVVIFLAGFIPFVGVLCPFLLFFVHAYYFGFSMADYSMDVWGKNVGESIAYARKHAGYMVGFGSLYSLLILVPFIGVFIAIAVAPSCVVGSARMMAEESNRQLTDNA